MKHIVSNHLSQNTARISARRFAVTMLLSFCILSNARAEQKPAQLTFDVASIRQSKAEGFGQVWDDDGGRGIKVRNMTLAGIIYFFFHIVDENFITGIPKWAATERFDIDTVVSDEDAKAYQKLSKMQRDEMLQALLVDRFNLKTHFEQRQMPVLVLTVKKGGAKLQPATPLGPPGSLAYDGLMFADGRQDTMRFKSAPMSKLIKSLSAISDHKVIDETGLTGVYDFSLKWDPSQGMSAPSEGDSEGETSRLSIYGAIEEQLGLKLQSRKLPQPVLVIDRITPPSEN